MEHAARFEEVQIQLPEPLGGVDQLSAVVGIPEWWPTGDRIAIAIAHGAGTDLNDPLVEAVHRQLAHCKYLTLRFNMPFAESGEAAEDQSPEVMDRAFRAALSVLGRDPTAAPSHLFIGGVGLGASVAARLASERLQVDGVFFLGYPLHPGRPLDQLDADALFRIVPAMLFVQGTADPDCDLPTLRKVLSRTGAQTTLRILDQADQSLTVPGSSEAEQASNRNAVARTLADWAERVQDGAL